MSAEPTGVCWVCGGSARPALDLPVSGLSRCSVCDFVFRPVSHTEVSESHDDAYFDDYSAGRAYVDQSPERRYEASQHMRWLNAHGVRPPGRLFEVGSAAGFFVEAASAAGWQARGIEPNDGMAAYARTQLGVEVQTGFVEDHAPAEATQDLIVLWHVLEHIPEPAGVLELLRNGLRPGGTIAIEVPNVASREAAALGAQWSHWAPHAHVSHFTPATLTRLLEQCGFMIQGVRTYPVWSYVEPSGVRLRWRLDAMRRERALPFSSHPIAHPLLRVCARRPV